MERSKLRIEIFYKTTDSREEVLLNKLTNLGFSISRIFITDNYLINVDLTEQDSIIIAKSLSQPVTQGYTINNPYSPDFFNFAIEIGFLPGVTDNVSHTVRESIENLLDIPLDPESTVFTSTTYFFLGDIRSKEAYDLGMELYNPLIMRMKVLSYDEYKKNKGMGSELPIVRIREKLDSIDINMNISDDDLLLLGKEGIINEDGIRRGPLALDMASLKTIQDYYNKIEKRSPTDIELESIAQTWSEHCKHTIFAARLDEIENGIFKEYIQGATLKIMQDKKEKGDSNFCASVFEDNSGGIEFDENYIISDKVETHNSPSALDPFGGSITGIVGVNRDTIGFGMAAKPIANRYGFCFSDPSDDIPLYRSKDKESKLLPPRRIMDGVVQGVNVGGNCSGIPTPQGFVYFDERYRGKPLVFVGTVGLIPKHIASSSSIKKSAKNGDYIVMVGGRVGRDGIHGATFSSEALSSGSPATAVQIGDPITQKKLSDAIVKEARDRELYNSITDNGAGGLSCSVAEMARESGGFEVNLEMVPLKYPGLSPWQIWISESQERMTLAVPPEKLDEFISLMEIRGVEATAIGLFTDSGRGIVKYNDKKVFDLDMYFLHEGLPKKILKSTYTRQSYKYPEFKEPQNYTEIFHKMISRLNTGSFEFISTQYDHEVQANSVIKPVQGKGKVNGNATVIRPIFDSIKGVALSYGLYPSYSDIDTYWMAASSIDTAVRNAVSVGVNIDKLALLDNFCWCDSNDPERLGQLKEAARACYEFAVSYGTPFISGKDSMFNDFKGYDENFSNITISIPPTLLISSIGIVDNIYKCQSIDFKFDGDIIYIIGITNNELGGSEYLSFMGETISGSKYIGDNIPKVNADENIRTYQVFKTAIEKELISSSISIERGGIGLAISKSSIAGMLGFRLDLSAIPSSKKLRDDTLLYSESQGRFLVSVDPSKTEEFESIFKDITYGRVGYILKSNKIEIIGTDNNIIVKTDVDSLRDSYKGVFKDL